MMDKQQEDSKKEMESQFAALLEDAFQHMRPRNGEVCEAVILSIGENDMLVDLDGKRDGIISPKDLDYVDKDYLAGLSVGDKVPVLVMRESRQHGGVQVSLNKGLEQQDWLQAANLLESEGVFEAEVIDVNRGGILVEFGRLRGFVPNSHLTSVPSGLKRDRFDEVKQELVGDALSMTVIEVNQHRRRLILSERVASRQKRELLLDELAEGDIRTGTVRNVVDFGAFVDLGGVDGLIHISELDWDYVEHPSKVLSVGDEVEVYVLSVDRERQRIGLSRKRVIPVETVQENTEVTEEQETVAVAQESVAVEQESVTEVQELIAEVQEPIAEEPILEQIEVVAEEMEVAIAE
ncbi:MAG: S1 RNA-binding domain-containing protein [Anaerolineae bacterium]|nr:S1 RNA-binding domain-containing protein [Anaerolineae bacterium]